MAEHVKTGQLMAEMDKISVEPACAPRRRTIKANPGARIPRGDRSQKVDAEGTDVPFSEAGTWSYALA